MNLTPEQIEWIVAEVIRRLKHSQPSERAPAREQSDTTVSLKEKVITLQLLEGKLTNVSRLSINPKAVVTPAVRDELKQRKIELVRQ